MKWIYCRSSQTPSRAGPARNRRIYLYHLILGTLTCYHKCYRVTRTKKDQIHLNIVDEEKKLPLPSEGGSGISLLGEFLEPTSTISSKSGKLAPLFGREASHTVEGESGQHDLLERLTNLSSRSNESGSKRSIATNDSRKNLPKPSQTGKADDLLSMFTTQSNEQDYDSENIVYEPADGDDDAEHEDYFDEGAQMSPRDVIKEASDVLSILSGHGGGIKPSVLTGRIKYSDEDSKSITSSGSRERPESQVSGKGYISDKSSSMVSGGPSKSVEGLAASLTSSHEGRQWNQNRAYFLRTAKLREAKKNSPLAKWLPGGALSSSKNKKLQDVYVDQEEMMSEGDQALVEQLQLELEEARRVIRSHETKILALQDEVEAARESCMEEECERVEAEIEKDKVHNENRILKVQIHSLENSTKIREMRSLQPRPKSCHITESATIAIQTEDLRAIKSMGDVLSSTTVTTMSLDEIERGDSEKVLSDIEEAGGLVITARNGNALSIPFLESHIGYKTNLLTHWMKALLLRECDFSGSLYKNS